jgi:hypothetical protein
VEYRSLGEGDCCLGEGDCCLGVEGNGSGIVVVGRVIVMGSVSAKAIGGEEESQGHHQGYHHRLERRLVGHRQTVRRIRKRTLALFMGIRTCTSCTNASVLAPRMSIHINEWKH